MVLSPWKVARPRYPRGESRLPAKKPRERGVKDLAISLHLPSLSFSVQTLGFQNETRFDSARGVSASIGEKTR